MKSAMIILFLVCCFQASAKKNVVLRGASSLTSSRSNLERRAKKDGKGEGKMRGRSCDPETSDAGVTYSCASKAKSDVIGFQVLTGEEGASIGITYRHELKEASDPSRNLASGDHEDHDSEDGNGDAERPREDKKGGHDDHNHDGYVHTKIEGQYNVIYSRLIEYLPANDTDELGFSWDEGDIVQDLRLSLWNGFSQTQDSEDGSELSFHVTTEDEYALFNFTLSRVDDDADDNRQLLSGDDDDGDRRRSSDTMKIDARFDNFPWKRNDTYLALISSVEATTEISSHEHNGKGKKEKKKARELEEAIVDEGEAEAEKDEESKDKPKKKPKIMKPSDAIVTFNVDDAVKDYLPFGQYTWVPNAEITDMQSRSSNLEVVATSPVDNRNDGDNTKKFIAYSFIDSSEARRIYWDPSAGVGYNDETSGAFSFGMGRGIACTLLCVASTLLLGSV